MFGTNGTGLVDLRPSGAEFPQETMLQRWRPMDMDASVQAVEKWSDGIPMEPQEMNVFET